MRLADLIRAMSAAGATPEAIAIAVEAIEGSQAADADRRAKQAERKARSRANRSGHGTVTGQSRDIAVTVTPPSSPNDGKPSSETSEGNLNPTTPPIVPPAAKTAASHDEHFENFRRDYPRRKGTDARPESRKAFDKAVRNGADPAFLALAARMFAQTDEGQRSEFVPMSATWLNKGRYEEFRDRHPAKPINGSDPKTWDELRWRRALNDARENGWPPSLGPLPSEPGSVVPRNLVGFGERFERRGEAA